MKKLSLGLVVFVVVACGGKTTDLDGGTTSDSGTSSDTGTSQPCTSDAQCGKGLCGFAMSEGCAAVGHCFPQPGAVCNGYSPGCSCAGDTINVICTGYPDGYVSAPFAYTGTCKAPPPLLDAGSSYLCGTATCVPGQDICYIPANVPNGGSCMPANGCTDCACAQSMFQCVSACKQSGSEIYIQCQ